MTIGKGFVTQTAFKKHLDGDWRTVHELWSHVRNYMTSYPAPADTTYTKTETDAFFEGYSGGKAQVDAGNVVGLTQGSIPFADSSGFLTEDNASLFFDDTNNNLGLGTTAFGANMVSGMQIATGTAPTGNQADTFAFYSADFAGGNACPYFRTEDGTVIGLNQSLLTTDSLTFAGLTVTDYIYFDKDTEHIALFGFECGKNLAATGTYNYFFGEQAGYWNTTGDFNIAIGYQALYYNRTIGQNIAIGYQALLGLGIGDTAYSQNVGIGFEAGEWIKSGATGNFLMGTQAGRNIQTASYCMFIGSAAGYYQRGNDNIAIGNQAMRGVGDSTAGMNINIGSFAGYDTVTGAAYNVNIGHSAGYYNEASDFSVRIGYRAGQGVNGSSHSYDVLIGGDAGKVISTAGSCVMIGYQAGLTVTTGGDHVLIGEKAGASLTTHTGCIMIGHDAGQNATVSNVLYIANSNTATPLIYGEFDNAYLLINGRLAVAFSTIGDDERGLSSIHTLSDNPAKSDGIGFYSEGHIGAITTDGPTYGAGIWLNIDAGATLGADVRALDIGIYEAGATCDGVNAYGLAIHMEFDDTNPPAAIYAFRINCNDTPGHATPDALIFAPNRSAIALTDAAPGTADAYLKVVLQDGSVYRIPLVKE